MLCLLLFYFCRVLTRSSSVYSHDFYCSPQGIGHGMCLLTWEFLLFSSVLPSLYASSFRLLLLRLCNNRCAEALVVKHKSQLDVKQQKEK